MTSTEVAIPTQDYGDDDGDVDQRYLSPEPPNEFLIFEQLFDMSRVEQLRTPTLALLKTLKTHTIENGIRIEMPRFTTTDINEAMIGFDLMADLHRGRTRKNTGYDESTHPALVGMLDLLANPDLTIDQLVTDYLHDAIEDNQDLGITPRHIRELLEMEGYPQSRADAISIGVEGLTRDNPNDQEGYRHKIKAYDKRVPHLKIQQRKLADTRHTMMSYTREMEHGQATPEKAKAYADRKAGPTLVAFGEPGSPNSLELEKAIVGFNNKLADHNERAHAATRGAAPRTVFTGRVRVLSPTR